MILGVGYINDPLPIHIHAARSREIARSPYNLRRFGPVSLIGGRIADNRRHHHGKYDGEFRKGSAPMLGYHRSLLARRRRGTVDRHTARLVRD